MSGLPKILCLDIQSQYIHIYVRLRIIINIRYHAISWLFSFRNRSNSYFIWLLFYIMSRVYILIESILSLLTVHWKLSKYLCDTPIGYHITEISHRINKQIFVLKFTLCSSVWYSRIQCEKIVRRSLFLFTLFNFFSHSEWNSTEKEKRIITDFVWESHHFTHTYTHKFCIQFG